MAELLITLRPEDAVTVAALAKTVHEDPNYPQLDRDKAWGVFLKVFDQLYGNVDSTEMDRIEHELFGNL